MKILYILALTILLIFGNNINAQKVNEIRLEVFIDCSYCDNDFITAQLPFINIVRDREIADIYLLFNRTKTGSGGYENTIIAYGNLNFNNIIDTTKYFTEVTDSYAKERLKMSNGIKAALIRFLVHTPLKTEISYNIEVDPKKKQQNTDDWNNWVFRIRLNNSFSQQETDHSLRIFSSLSAKRITEDWKLLFSLVNDYKENFYSYDDQDVLSINRAQSFRTYVIKSIGDHWSLGVWGSAYRSSYSNIDLALELSPGIEYNIFPYSDYTSRQFRINYKLEFSNINYLEKTIYLKSKENLIQQSLFIGFDLIKIWGSVGIDLKGSQYMHDISFYSIDFSSRISLNLVRGLTIDFYGFASAIHDQLNIPVNEASLEDVLLRRREITTQFKLRGSIGFSYYFGSILNNIVNPRFDG